MINKIVYSYWSAPLESRWSNYIKGLSKEDNKKAIFNCLLLSVLYAKKWGFRIELITDLYGEKQFKDFPFDKISTELEFLTFKGKSWVQGKVLAIALQNEPFIHLDWDVFLLKKEVVFTLKSFKEDLLVQSVDTDELFVNNYRELLTNLHWHMDFTPYHIKGLHKTHKKAFNCGVMGFNNMKLKNEFVNSFIKCCSVSEAEIVTDMSLIVEQGLLYAIVEASGYSFNTILGKHKPSAKQIGYTHLVYLSKYSEKNQTKIKQRIQKEFSAYYSLIEPKKEDLKNEVLLSLCTVAMNRLEHVIRTLKHNYNLVKTFNGIIDIHFLDYNSIDGLEDYLFAKDWFIEGINSKLIHYYKEYSATVYHRTLPKNKVHELASGLYLVNIDADNFVSKAYLEFVLNHIKYSENFFIRPHKYEKSDGFGRILLKKEDFVALGGYNLKFRTYGFEDSEIVARLKLLGKTQITAPVHICNGNIKHSDMLRIEDKREQGDVTSILKKSELSNKQTTVELYPNQKIKVVPLKVFRLDKTKNKLSV